MPNKFCLSNVSISSQIADSLVTKERNSLLWTWIWMRLASWRSGSLK